MEAIRKIVLVKDNLLKVEMPAGYNGKQVELIILSAKDPTSMVEESEVDYYTKFYGKLKSDLSKKEVDSKLKFLREEWNRDLS